MRSNSTATMNHDLEEVQTASCMINLWVVQVVVLDVFYFSEHYWCCRLSWIHLQYHLVVCSQYYRNRRTAFTSIRWFVVCVKSLQRNIQMCFILTKVCNLCCRPQLELKNGCGMNYFLILMIKPDLMKQFYMVKYQRADVATLHPDPGNVVMSSR